MSRSRNQNSILAVATLGVYLGLILAGSTTSVLSQRTLANIDLKMPAGERAEVGEGLNVYLGDVEYFLNALARLQARGKFDARRDTFDLVEVSLQPCVNENVAGSYTPVKLVTTAEAIKPAIDWFSRGMQYGYSLGDCVVTEKFDKPAVDNNFSFQFDGEHLTINVAIRKETDQRALELVNALNSSREFHLTNAASSSTRQTIAKNTVFSAKNAQILIVTRLPRGSLDTLFAEKAK